MLFNSPEFIIFLAVVFALYWGVRHTGLGPEPAVRFQNILLIAAGFVFYGWWDPRFLLLLLATSLTDYGVALAIGRAASQGQRKAWLAVSLIGNLGTLGVFKYYDFFASSLADGLGALGVQSDPFLLHVILPVGISFYTFQALSYTIDVYRGRIAAVRDPSTFLAFVSFFPQLCAGPIERASHMLPQFQRQRVFDPGLAADGLRQMLWGFFKKMVIADNCAAEVDRIFGHHAEAGASTLLLGAVLFAFQIYGDFSGYSDIAIGCARLFGFELMRNFAFPYFSRDIAEFWRRWHISLSSWFRDYLYIPLGGSRGGLWPKVRNTFIIFLVSGFWHGANWTFIAWGALNAIYFLPLLLRGANREHLGIVAADRILPNIPDALRMLGTFLLTCLAWVFFRAKSMTEALEYLRGLFHSSILEMPDLDMNVLPFLILAFVAVEWIGRRHQHALQGLVHVRLRSVRWSAYACLIALIGFFMATEGATFIYFQF
jgi:alginate O-acetyltransferase complex protein AlgI